MESQLLGSSSNKKQVSFVPAETNFVIEFDCTLSKQERDRIWYDPDELKARAQKEISLARRLWKNQHQHQQQYYNNHRDYCWRGLEKRLKSPEATRKKWYTFLHSFLALQADVRRLNPTDNSHLLSVFASANSKGDRAKAHQRGMQDEAAAFQVHAAAAAATATATATSFCDTSLLRINKLHLNSSSSSSSTTMMTEKRGSFNSGNSQTSNTAGADKKQKSGGCPRARSA